MINLYERIVCHVYDKNSKLLGYLAIDSTINGRSRGGLRILPDISEKEITDLAQAMTLKYGFLGAHTGGAKAGILIREKATQEERRYYLYSFAQAIKPFIQNDIYRPSSDMGTDWTDINYLLHSCGARRNANIIKENSGFFTGMSVIAGIIEAVKYFKIRLEETTLAIEGFGKVGASVAHFFAKHGGKIVAVSTRNGAIYSSKGLNVKKLIELREKYDGQLVDFYKEAERISRGELLELTVDILSPCARNDSINISNASKIKARVISSGANNPVTPEAEEELFKQGILCLPDFITNCGGILGTRLGLSGFREEAIKQFINRHLGFKIARILEICQEEHLVPKSYAKEKALEKFYKYKQKLESSNTKYFMNKFLRAFISRRVVPKIISSSLGNWYYQRLIK